MGPTVLGLPEEETIPFSPGLLKKKNPPTSAWTVFFGKCMLCHID